MQPDDLCVLDIYRGLLEELHKSKTIGTTSHGLLGSLVVIWSNVLFITSDLAICIFTVIESNASLIMFAEDKKRTLKTCYCIYIHRLKGFYYCLRTINHMSGTASTHDCTTSRCS